MNIKQFLKLYGKQTTSNFDLIKIAKVLEIKNFHVLMRDELCVLKNFSSLNFITNLHTSYEKGIHWSAGKKIKIKKIIGSIHTAYLPRKK